MKVTARQDREPIVDGILSGYYLYPHLGFIYLLSSGTSFPLLTNGARDEVRLGRWSLNSQAANV